MFGSLRASTAVRLAVINCNDQKRLLYDFRANNIDSLRYSLGSHDWSDYMNCLDVQIVYDNFVHVILANMKQCIPWKVRSR